MLNATPRANRLHIGIFGKRNSGKSSLTNALTGHSVSVVSDRPGTTTDPVYKSMELHPIGPVVFIDTAGFDDEGDLGMLRVEKTQEIVEKTDIAIMLFSDADFSQEKDWTQKLEKEGIPVIPVVSKSDESHGQSLLAERIEQDLKRKPILVSALRGEGLEAITAAIEEAVPEDFKRERILKGLVSEGDLVMLVMPQDIQAPKGRLILPQVQTIRELLDNHCITVCTTAGEFASGLTCLSKEPALIITDSQCFKQIYEQKPKSSSLTSFSVLFAAYKGDIHAFTDGAQAIDSLTSASRVLIAEACTHAPLEEDIGRVKIPRMLKKRFGESLRIDMASGNDFPEDLREYDLIIHCGACMFNRRHVLSRIARAKEAGVPITNYGITMAKLNGILDKIQLPE